MMDLDLWKRSRREMAREEDQNCLSKELRSSRRRRNSERAFILSWGMKRVSGRLAKWVARRNLEEMKQR